MSETAVTTSPNRQQSAPASTTNKPSSATPGPSGSAVQLKSSLRGLDFASQSALLTPPDQTPGGVVQQSAVQRKSSTGGSETAAIQEKLTRLGFDCGPIDGAIGPQTRSAIMAFQESRGLTVDGICGPVTLAALDAAAGGGEVAPVTTPEPATEVAAPAPTAGGDNTTAAPEEAAKETPSTPPVATTDGQAGGKPAYLSQRDNDSDYGSGDVQCSPTSFTMQLINVYKGDAEAVKTRARAILTERGAKSDYDQAEDLIIEILQTTDWKAATAQKPSFFWDPKNWAAWAAKTYGGIYYKDPNAQQYVASLFDGVTNTKSETHSQLYTYKDWAPIIDALNKGAAVTAQGAFTSAGHVVSIISADASGIVINDPYGLYVEAGYYLRNGEAARVSLGASGMSVLQRRAQLRSDVVPAYEGDKALPNWGESNFYNWDEVASVQIGKWLSVLGGS